MAIVVALDNQASISIRKGRVIPPNIRLLSYKSRPDPTARDPTARVTPPPAWPHRPDPFGQDRRLSNAKVGGYRRFNFLSRWTPSELPKFGDIAVNFVLSQLPAHFRENRQRRSARRLGGTLAGRGLPGKWPGLAHMQRRIAFLHFRLPLLGGHPQ